MTTEANEVAASLLPGYLKHREERWAVGRLAGTPETYVMNQLSATESYNTIDAVGAALRKLVNAEDKPR